MTSTNSISGKPRCMGCRHVIRSAESISTGYGKGCRAKMRKAAAAADLSVWTPRQVEDARQAIEDGAVVPGTRNGVFHVVSSDGAEVYRTHRDGCTCANGLLTHPGRPCWHRLAVVLVLGGPAPAAPVRVPLALPAAPVPAVAPVDVWAALEAVGALDLIPAF